MSKEQIKVRNTKNKKINSLCFATIRVTTNLIN